MTCRNGYVARGISESLQVLSDVLKRKEIYSYFSRSAMEKAHAYQAQGRVSGMEVSDDLSHISSQFDRDGGIASAITEGDVNALFDA